MSENMIERVAKAMRAESGGKPFSWENAARAAIEALRQPTEEMIEAGDMVLDSEYFSGEPVDVWRAMIDATLCKTA
jgi:hypothetical protein